MDTPALLGWVKRSDNETADKYIFIELIDVIGFAYDLGDTQDGLKFLRMGFIFCGKHLLMTRIQVSDQGPMGPLFLSFDGHMKTSSWLVDLKGAVCTRIRSGKVLCCQPGYYCSMTLVGI